MTTAPYSRPIRALLLQLADTLANPENPVGSARLRYQFLDLNGNRLLDGPQELGAFRSTQGTSATEVADDIERPYSQELSTHIEREIMSGLSGRVSYVYKNVRNEWVEIDPTSSRDDRPFAFKESHDGAAAALTIRSSTADRPAQHRDQTSSPSTAPAYKRAARPWRFASSTLRGN